MNHLLEALALLGWTPTEVCVPTEPLPPSDRPEVPDQRPVLAWGAKVSETFRDRVWWIADELTKLQGALFDANWLMACMAFETGEKFTADVRNPVSTATGLIQFMRDTILELTHTPAQLKAMTAAQKVTKGNAELKKLAAMTAEDQLRYVFRYFERAIKTRGAIRSIDDCYMAILWPAAVGKPSEHKLWVKGSSQYAVNAGLDKNKDSVVTKAEAASKVMEKLVKGLQTQYAA